MANPENLQDPDDNKESSLQEVYEAISIPKENLIHVLSKELLPQDVDFLELKQEADHGNAESQFFTGICYQEGILVKKSYKLSSHYFELAAEQGHPQAQLCLGMLYEEGLGTKRSYEKAFNYYKLAADQGISTALVQLGSLYLDGKSVEKDPKKALRYFEMADNQGNPTASYYLSEIYEKGIGVKKSEEKAHLYRQHRFIRRKELADLGDAEAQATVGFCYENGEGVEKSLESAVHYYQLSAEQNFPSGLYGLAECFARGLGIQKSIEQAIHYHRLAAKAGYVLSMYGLASLLLKMKGEEEEAVCFLKLIVQQGNEVTPKVLALCQYELGECFEKGVGVKKSIQSALRYYRLSADHGNVLALSRLGEAYFKGELGLKKSQKQSLHYFRLSAEQGDPLGLKIISYADQKDSTEPFLDKPFDYYKQNARISVDFKKMRNQHGFKQVDQKTSQLLSKLPSFVRSSKGDSVKTSTPSSHKTILFTSLEDCKKAAEEGNAEAQLNLGKLFDEQSQHEKAFKYYEKAATQGNAEAQLCLGNCYELGKGTDEDHLKAFHYYQLAANQGNNAALCNLADCYSAGVNQSKSEAFILYKKAADRQYARGQYEVAYCYQWGIGVEISMPKAIEYYKKALAQKYKIDRALNAIFTCEDNLNSFQNLQLKADRGDAKAQSELGSAYDFGKYGQKKDRSLATHYFTLAASQGDLQACKMMFYRSYKGAEKSLKKALFYLKILVETKQPEFIDYLGEFYEKGYGELEQSYENAFKYYKIAADLGSAHSQFMLGLYFKNGVGTAQSIQDAFKYIKLASDSDMSTAQYEVAEMYRLGIGICQSDEKALDYYLRSANWGNSNAQKALSQYYQFGLQKNQPYEETLKNIRKLALKSTSIFQYELGEAFAEGDFGLTQSDENAFIYYKLAADQGHPTAQFCVGDAYRTGKGVEKSYEDAREYLKKAAMQDEYDACSSLAEYFHYGIDPNQPYEETLRYIKNFATKTSAQSLTYKLGLDFEIGEDGLKQSYEEAFNCFKIGADQGYSSCQFAVGLYYHNGRAVERSDEQAFKYFQLAADQGHTRAHYYMGEAYRKGEGTEQSDKYAREHYRKAAMRGNEYARAALAQHYRYLIEIDLENASYEEILEYLRSLALKGSCNFQHNLGVAFEYGTNGLQQSYEEAFKCFQLAADRGYASSQNIVGFYYAKGMGVQQSYEKAFKYFQLAANQGLDIAQDNLGLYFQEGRGTEQSYEKAFYYFKLAADQGYASSQNNVGFYFAKGTGVQQSYEEAFKYFQLAANQGLDIAQDNLGLYFQEGRGTEQSYEKAFHYFKLAADQGNASSLNRVGCYFAKGMGVQQSYEEATKYFKMAADQGNILSQYSLGMLFKEGKISFKEGFVIEQSYENAFKYFELAANNGYSKAQCELGDLYRCGQGIEQSYEKAVKYYQLAADQGLAKAQGLLADRYYYGEGIEWSPEKALHYYQLGAAKNNLNCLYRLGFYFKDRFFYNKSFKYFKRSADQGYAPGLYAVANCYRDGLGVEKSFQKAIEYYELALAKSYNKDKAFNEIETCKQAFKDLENYQIYAAKGDPKAQFRLGMAYYKGELGLERDFANALDHFALAAEQGFIPAILKFYDLYRHSKNVEESSKKLIRFLSIGAEAHDSECLFALGVFYEKGQGNVTASFFDALRCYRLAADQWHPKAKAKIESINQIFQFNAQRVDISLNHNPSTLQAVLHSYAKKPIFLEGKDLTSEELEVIRDAMIENHNFTFMGSKSLTEQLFFDFESIGYNREKDLRYGSLTSPVDQPKLYGCIFIGEEDKRKVI